MIHPWICLPNHLRLTLYIFAVGLLSSCTTLTPPPLQDATNEKIIRTDLSAHFVFSPDGQLILSSGSYLWSVATAENVGQLQSGGSPYAFSPDGRLVAAAGWRRGEDRVIRLDGEIGLFDAADTEYVKARLETLLGHHGRVNSIAYSPDGQLLASSSEGKTDEDRAIKVWSIVEQQELGRLRGHNGDVNVVAFSPDGFLLASGGVDGTIRLWSLDDGTEITTLLGHKDSVTSIAFSRDGQLLASGSWDTTVKLWSVGEGKEIATLRGHRYRVRSIAFSPDGELLASAANSGEGISIKESGIKVWSVSKKKVIATLDGINPVAFSPDGRLLAGRVAVGIRLWKVEDLQSRK